MKKSIFSSIASLLLLTAISCAVQKTPTGGERDEEAPKLISTLPVNQTLNFSVEEVVIEFDEYVKLENQFKEISIMPELEDKPEIRVKKNTIVIKFDKAPQDSTTYVINFGKSIADMNEGNKFPNYKYVFSTGPFIDSLKISGSVKLYGLQNSKDNKEAALENVIVMLHPNKDSLILQKKPLYYTYLDSLGNFEITNLKDGIYRLYALKDENNSRIYDDPNEQLAFLGDSINLQADTSGISLTLAKLENKILSIVDDNNQDAKLSVLLSRKSKNLSTKILFPDKFKDKAILEQDELSDSVFIWLPSPTYDSVKLAIGENNTYIDTILFRNFNPKTELSAFTISDNLSTNILKPASNPLLTFSRPVNNPSLDSLQLLEDSTVIASNAYTLKKTKLREYELIYNWKPQHYYTLKIPDSAIVDIYSAGNKAYEKKFLADSLPNFGNLLLDYSIADSSGNSQFVVQLIDANNKVLQSDIINLSKTIEYKTLFPGTYSIRVIYDTNKNGRWDGGYLFEKQQPEKVINFTPENTLRANWDQNFTIKIPKLNP